MKKLFLSLFLVFGMSFACLAANDATDIYVLAQTKNATELQKIKNIDIVDSEGNTALCSAIKYEDVNSYNLLKEAGANTKHKCVKKFPKKQYNAFMRKVTTASRPWDFLGASKFAWGVLGVGVAGVATTLAVGSSGNGTSIECPYTTTTCTGGWEETGRKCRSGGTIYVECKYVVCPSDKVWTPTGCVTPDNVNINENNITTNPIYGRINEPNADNVGARVTINNAGSNNVKAVYANTPNINAVNVITSSHNHTVVPNENITGTVVVNNTIGGSEVSGIFADTCSGCSIDAINIHYDRANFNGVPLNLNGEVQITDSGNIVDGLGEIVGINSKSYSASNLYIDQYGDGEVWKSANINATVQITNLGNKPVYGIMGFRLNNAYSDHEIITTTGSASVNANITISNQGSGDVYGMFLKGSASDVDKIATNAHNANGSIAIGNTGSGRAYGMHGPNLVNLDVSETPSGQGLIPSANISMYNYSDGVAFGMLGTTVSNEKFDSLPNTANVTLQNLGSGRAVGLYAVDSAINSGSITINNTSTGTAIGIFGESGSVVDNSGAITITRQWFTDTTNLGVAQGTVYAPTGTAGYAIGIYAKNGSIVNNSGTINISSNGNMYGIYVEENSIVENTGTISLNGASCSEANCAGNYIVLNGSTLFQNGVVTAPTLDLDSMGGNVVANLGSKFVVEDTLSGDLNISSDIVQSGNQTTYIAENMIDAGDTAGLNILSGSAMFDASLADNNHDVVMQMKNFESLTDNQSLAAFLADNYSNGNGMELFSSLKSMENMSAFDDALSGFAGLNTFTQFAHEDMSAMREISFSMNNKLFENSEHDSFDISDGMGYFSFSSSHNSGAGQYGITSGKVSENWKLGYGMAMANINTGNGDGLGRQNKMWLFYMPATYTNEGYELVVAPKAGFADSRYTRRGYNNVNYEGYIEKQIFGLMNDLRYPMHFGSWTVAPDMAFNAIVYTQSGHEEAKEFGLIIPDDRTVSIETGMGLYTKYDKVFGDNSCLKLNSGLMMYREFGDTYDIELGIQGMDGTFSLYNNDYKYRGAASMGFDYTTGQLHLYGNVQYFMDNANYANFKGGVSYRF